MMGEHVLAKLLMVGMIALAAYLLGCNNTSREWINNCNSKRSVKRFGFKPFKVIQAGNQKSFDRFNQWLTSKDYYGGGK